MPVSHSSLTKKSARPASALHETVPSAYTGTVLSDLRPEAGAQRMLQTRVARRTSDSEAARLQRRIEAGPLVTDRRLQLARLGGLPIQAKMTINPPDDHYEREADRVAGEVVSQINAPTAVQTTVQRQAPEEEELMTKRISSIQRAGAPGEEELMAKSVESSGAMPADSSIESAIQQARGGGQPISEGVRQPLEQAFGADFSGVRVHTDNHSDQINRSIQARAFTTGSDVFFRQGEYNPGTRGGQELLAHELTHVVQQGGG